MTLREKLGKILNQSMLNQVICSCDVVGDIAVIKIPVKIEHKADKIAEAVMQSNPHIKTVLQQTSPVEGELRLRSLKWLAGENKTETLHRESGCIFKVDLEKCYFSPRLSFERMRVAKQVMPSEVVVNMFTGVGCFSILIAKHSKPRKVYSIDINPDAIRYLNENIILNKANYIVESIEGDAKEVILGKLQNLADRVLMPLPEKAFEYLDYALLALKTEGGKIHYYDFVYTEKGKDPIEEVQKKVSEKLRTINITFRFTFGRIVRTVGPRWYQVVLDIYIHKKDNRANQHFNNLTLLREA
ncbi:class I SAM-dependent methyltransferase family protein [Candidatus Bathyarchaeota archaeon]|nr:class I SAM-dependent methyltransferase family protein [Candidatus Bathyarchaeota archaeon]